MQPTRPVKGLFFFAVLALLGLGLMLWPGEPSFSQRPGPEASADGTFAPLPPVRRIAIRARDQECLDLVRERALRTPATEFTGTKIKDLRVADSVLGENPKGEDGEEIPAVSRGQHSFNYSPDAVLRQGLTLEVTDGVITQASPATHHGLVGSRYVMDDVDATDVTPALWRILDLEMPKPDGSFAKLAIARPLWWIEQTGAKAGKTIDLGLQEIGISGEAKVLSLDPCTADSRALQPGKYVVTGTIRHENVVVFDLGFEEDTAKPLGVTANHPIYSDDREDWVPAGELRISEKVRTVEGTAVLKSKSQRPIRQTVYNLEVHRCHAYHVTGIGVVAHNSNVVVCNPGQYLFKNWHKGTFPNRTQSVKYHVDKHGNGRSPVQYTQAAMDFYQKNKHLGQAVTLKDGAKGIKIQTTTIDPITGKKVKVGGYWTDEGRLVTFWD